MYEIIFKILRTFVITIGVLIGVLFYLNKIQDKRVEMVKNCETIYLDGNAVDRDSIDPRQYNISFSDDGKYCYLAPKTNENYIHHVPVIFH